MSGNFEERDKIDRALHPEHLWMPKIPEDPLDKALDAGYQHPLAGGQGPQGSHTRHITGHYEGTKTALDPKQSVGKLDSEAERWKALDHLTQQQDGGLDSEARCGAMVLLAGSMMAGGGTGISTLINAVEAMKKKGGPVDDAAKAQMAQLDKLKKKIANKEALTNQDLMDVSNDVYDLMKKEGRDGDKEGMKKDQMSSLFANSPELRKLWKEHDLSYDSVDITGAGQGGHAVLGIGHGKNDKDHKGAHQAVYDPYHRTTRDANALRNVSEAADRVGYLSGIYPKGHPSIVEAEKALAAAQAAEKGGRKEAGQIITEGEELDHYLKATNTSYEFNGPGKSGINFKRPSEGL